MRDLSGLSAAILAGGMGTRLRAAVRDRPKPLAEIHGRPFVTYLLDHLADSGMRHVVLCAGYRAEMVEKTLGRSYRGMDLEYSVEAVPLGTGGALRLALPRSRSDSVLVMNGDSYCDVDLAQFLVHHEARKGRADLVLRWVADSARFGRVELDATDRVVSFGEKAARGPGWINAGIYLISTSLVRELPEQQNISLEREMFPRWIGAALFGYRTEGKFIDIGTPESFARAERFFEESPAALR